MKKILMLLLAIMLATGCDEKEKEESLPSKYNDLNNEIKEEITTTDIPNMQDIDINMLKTEYGLNLDLVENYISGISTTEEYKLYLAIKPKKSKEATIKKAMNMYFTNLETRLSTENTSPENDSEKVENTKLTLVQNRIETEINGYYVYIVSENQDEILKVLKSKLE